jgi:hypothetical protein
MRLMIYLPSQGANDWRKLLADPEKQWRVGYSAYATAQCWENANGFPIEIAAMLGENVELVLAIPEHVVPLPGGARGSQCDVFAVARTATGLVSVAVEGKVAEPFGPTIGEWLREDSPGKRKRLTHICGLLGLSGPAPDLRYQLFHRTAAAIIEADRFHAGTAAMIVHSFSQEHLWFEDFAAFCQLFDVEPERGAPVEVMLPNGKKLILGWATGPARFLSSMGEE